MALVDGSRSLYVGFGVSWVRVAGGPDCVIGQNRLESPQGIV